MIPLFIVEDYVDGSPWDSAVWDWLGYEGSTTPMDDAKHSSTIYYILKRWFREYKVLGKGRGIEFYTFFSKIVNGLKYDKTRLLINEEKRNTMLRHEWFKFQPQVEKSSPTKRWMIT